ncbi:MAG: hypothetical protein JJT89_03900 [Nitriliruptoraceae bacterium]|nr:hypothetical protein [Nitriliruptoraceae bacterium]
MADEALLTEASGTARDAAAAADVTIEDVHEHHVAARAAAVLDEVWERSSGTVMSPEALTALAHAGGQVTIARRGERIVGATAAFLGRDEDTGTTFLHSHVTGVPSEHAGTGVGRALKWAQRRWCLDRDIAEVRWTFDPLVRRNAVLNLVLLGAQATRYDLDVYGPMDDARNAGLPTDRLVAVWTLGAPRVRAAARGRAASPDPVGLRHAGAEVALEVGEDGAPIRHTTSAPRQLVRIPPDIEQLRAEDRALAAAWAQALRDTLGAALSDGARLSGFTRDGWYALARPGGVTELADRA